GNFPGFLLLGKGAAAQIRERTLQRTGQLLGALAHLGSQSSGKLLEIFKQHFGLAQVFLKDLDAIKIAERTLKAEPIKGVKNPHDILLVFFYKRVKGVVCWSRGFLLHETVLLHEPRSVSSEFKVCPSGFEVRRSPSSTLHPRCARRSNAHQIRLRLCRAVFFAVKSFGLRSAMLGSLRLERFCRF